MLERGAEVPMRFGGLSIEIEREFPCATISATDTVPDRSGAALTIDVVAWRAEPFDPAPFDRAASALEPKPELSVLLYGPSGTAFERTAIEVLTRYQRLMDRRNAASLGDAFSSVLALHKSLHDTSKPLVLADLQHSLDTWQWLLRLEPEASLAAQIAALFHDIERLISEPDERYEQHAPDYQAYKDAHARAGAEMMRAWLRVMQIEPATIARAAWLVAGHEKTSADDEINLLNEADSLSFFSLYSSGFTKSYGPDHTRRKVEHLLARLPPARQPLLGSLRLSPEIRALVANALPTSDCRQ